MIPLTPGFKSYGWAPSTKEIAELSGLDPIEVLRFDANVPADPLPVVRASAVASAVATVNTYLHGGYADLIPAIAGYAEVEPENIVLGAGSDDLIMLCTRSFAGPGDKVAIASDPTYPMFAIAAGVVGATVGNDDPALTFVCRPNNPTGALDDLPSARPLVVDEAYYEYCGESAVDLIEDGVIVLRTFSKAFGLAGARIGYALASREIAAELNRRQSPAPISSLSAALALEVLKDPPDVRADLEERDRLEKGLRDLGFAPLPSHTNFLFAPAQEPEALRDALMLRGLAVRAAPGGIRISVRNPQDDDVLLRAIGELVGAETSTSTGPVRRVRRARNTAETRVAVDLQLDGHGRVRVSTGAGIYDHFVEQLAFHAAFDLFVSGGGDLENGEHHLVEDTSLALGEALDAALGERTGITRFGDAVVPMDDAIAKAAVDLGGRAWAEIDIEPDPGMATHALRSLATSSRIGLHVSSEGRDAHHVAEAAYKAVGRALRQAVAVSSDGVPSTKGVL
jgi:histidinol-phosphate/aromatic aminotransferase/cobyric acid decarboxylase-like protein/imidazoleglycerol phosphate dehydratase HisB